MSAINDLQRVFNEHFYVEEKKDITVILSKEDMLELVKGIDTTRYEDLSINYEGDFFFVSSILNDDTGILFVENVYNEDGILKFDETDILFIHHLLPQEIKVHAIERCGYTKLLVFLESDYERMIELLA